MRLLTTATLVTLILDQASKFWIVQGLNLRDRGAIDVFPPWINLRMAWNEGVNFGLFAGGSEIMRIALVIIALAISGFVWWWVRKEPGVWTQLLGGLLIGGALGNVIDRLLYGAVADFLNMSCCGINNPYAFNVADIAIFIGAFGLVLLPARDKAQKTP